MSILTEYFTKIWRSAFYKNIDNILTLLEKNKQANVVDIGCGGGEFTVLYQNKIDTKNILGVDGVPDKLKLVRKRGIPKTLCFDLEQKWKLKSNAFDAVVSNQVFEHIANLDNFISETYRILKPGGYAVISTENLSSWHNIGALILGYQDFSHQLIKKVHTGNPMALHNSQKTGTWSNEESKGIDDSDFPHVKIVTYRSFRQVFEAYGLEYQRGYGSGYYPLPPFLANIVSRFDPYHSHFITIKIRKN
jgi:2-polyprenyl-3-methyl-5-hydroxy-6-metoxy-1,4-benzoquinol methylase